MPLSRQSVGIYQETSSHATHQGPLSHPKKLSQLAKPLWTDPGLEGATSVHELISTLKKKKCRQGMNCQTFS